MSDVRPNPDELLARVQAEEESAGRGRLKIFFGYAAGVGKTFSMLQNARPAKKNGREVVVGYVEPHARPETQALAEGFETIPPRVAEYRGVNLREFDVDAALARHPDLLLVDELAHSNVEGSRHAKRWQDVEELLAAGINVWTTLNVQHIESLNDVVGQVTGVSVRETIPDRIFEEADELELIDLAPDDLLERLHAGKIYIPEQAQRALQSFFQKSNLNALRELSLRQAARRIHTEVESARHEKAVRTPWGTVDRLLVCIGPSPTTARVIRTAKRMATALDAPWLAAAVELPGAAGSHFAKEQIARHFQLAERLGAETAVLDGSNVAETILDFARTRNVTKILVGKTNQPRWKRLLWGTVIDELLEESGKIDIYVIQGEEESAERILSKHRKRPVEWRTYGLATATIAVTGMFAEGLRRLHFADSEANTVMLFLAAVAWVAFRIGRQGAIFASILAVLVFDFFFVPPLITFVVADAQYLVTFLVMLAIGLLISTLASRLRAQVEGTRLRERRTSALYELGKQLSSLSGEAFLVSSASAKIAEITGGEIAVYLRKTSEIPLLVSPAETPLARHLVSLPTARWVMVHDQPAGAATNTLPNAAGLFFPLRGSQQILGAVGIRVDEPARLLDPDTRRMLEACFNQLALALERDQLVIEAAESRIHAETEQIRSTLLSSVSHDLKTPLAVIAGASSSLLESPSVDESVRRELLETISEEAVRLGRLLENILQMSRFEAGGVVPNQQWHVLEEIFGSALHRVRRELEGREVEVRISGELPLVFVDGLLMEQLLVNLLENLAKYTPSGSPVSMSAGIDAGRVRIAIADRGPGFPAGNEERIFEKFYREHPTADGGRGSGLGLAICRAIVQAHGGKITASNREGGGGEFVIQLPLVQGAPEVVVE